MDIAKCISFRFKFFNFRFVSVNGIKIFPLTHISSFR